jgi:Tol biopolymer transport system component
LCVQYFLDGGDNQPLFWTNFRVPQGGWGHSSIAVLNENQVVMDRYERNAILQEFPLHGGPARTITPSVGFDRQPVYSPDGRQILFSSNRSGNIDLWLVDLDSGELTQVTDDQAHDWDPAFSPDGRHILWSSNRGGHMEIWISNRDGTGARQVSNDGLDAENPTMTPDGQWIVYASANDDHLGLWRIRPDGTDAEHLHRGTDLIPEVSPDGRYALFSTIRSLNFVIKVVDLATGAEVPFEIEIVLSDRAQDVVYGRARWTPDGSGIIYVGQGPEGNSGIFLQDFDPEGGDTSATRRPLAGFSDRYSTESLGASPDGARIVVSTVFTRQTLVMADEFQLSAWD